VHEPRHLVRVKVRVRARARARARVRVRAEPVHEPSHLEGGVGLPRLAWLG